MVRFLVLRGSVGRWPGVRYEFSGINGHGSLRIQRERARAEHWVNRDGDRNRFLAWSNLGLSHVLDGRLLGAFRFDG